MKKITIFMFSLLAALAFTGAVAHADTIDVLIKPHQLGYTSEHLYYCGNPLAGDQTDQLNHIFTAQPNLTLVVLQDGDQATVNQYGGPDAPTTVVKCNLPVTPITLTVHDANDPSYAQDSTFTLVARHVGNGSSPVVTAPVVAPVVTAEASTTATTTDATVNEQVTQLMSIVIDLLRQLISYYQTHPLAPVTSVIDATSTVPVQ